MFEWNHSYTETDPQTVRSDFAELALVYDHNVDKLAMSLANYISSDTLREFLDDVAMGRV